MPLKLDLPSNQWFCMGLVCMGSHSQVPSPSHVSKSQHGDKVPTSGPQDIIEICLIVIKMDLWILMRKYLRDLCWELGLAFCLTHLDTSPKIDLQRMYSCRHPCHTWDLGLGTPCEVVNPNFHALNHWDCMDKPQVIWDLGFRTLCEPALNHTNTKYCIYCDQFWFVLLILGVKGHPWCHKHYM
jgi:hypothetical protein